MSIHIRGCGEATTFEDDEDNHSNWLKKSGVATKKVYDNIPSGTKVNVTAKKKGTTKKYSKNITKNDVGGMLNATINIWKSGVEYWKYKYYNGLSLSGEVTIFHD